MRYKYKDIMKKAREEQATEEMFSEMDDLTQDFVDCVNGVYPDKAKEFLEALADAVCFPPITEQKAISYVRGMENKDGSHGEHWSLPQVKELYRSKGFLKEYALLDFYVAVNMVWSDYYRQEWTDEEYIRLACDFLGDKDAPKNKMSRYMSVMR